ncbi:MAG: 50S ribosomal protein L17 [Marinoscillum sp.]
MRHGKKFNHLGRTASHRKAMLSNMASSLILHKRINTTVAKAKALRKYVEPLITKAKTDTTHSRRIAFSYLQDKQSVTELFGPIAEKITARPGGYTRIIKTGIRLGDNAEMCMMELVDFNELLLQENDASKSKTRRSRRGGKKETDTTPKAEAVVEEAVVVEEVPTEEETKAEETAAVESPVEEAPEAKAEEATEEKGEEAADDAEEKKKSE